MKGLIHVYTGDGKGKTTAALGLALRFAGYGKRVLIIQFSKGRTCGELRSLGYVPNISVLRLKEEHKFFKSMSEDERAKVRTEHDALLDVACKKARRKECDLLVLDEVISAYNHDLLDREFLDSLIEDKPEELELVLTGRNAPQEFIDVADYVTEMRKIKHPYDQGFFAREGVEF
ncbi:MAG: cob(I)yrinic acid a,c-diamide adenosyltransferase [Actinobacteria bacterium]|nr:cob(I)yrinic acid a,c-diamide adenosyltransferase [Actinomycetota bacterium]